MFYFVFSQQLNLIYHKVSSNIIIVDLGVTIVRNAHNLSACYCRTQIAAFAVVEQKQLPLLLLLLKLHIHRCCASAPAAVVVRYRV